MKLNNKAGLSGLLAGVFSMLVVVSIAQAGERITDVAAGAWSWGAGTPVKAVNGAGLSGDAHSTTTTDMWYSSGGVDGHFLVIDLKHVYQLDSAATLRVWNFNQVNVTTRGMKNATFDYSLESVTWTPLNSVTTDATSGNTFDEAPGAAGYTSYNTVSFNEPVLARYVRITAAGGSNVGTYGDGSIVGLSEVQVFGTFQSAATNVLGPQITGVTTGAYSAAHSAPYTPAKMLGPGLNTTTLNHGTGVSDAWMLPASPSTAFATFDLGISQPIGHIRLWNGNYILTRAFKMIDILVSDVADFSSGVTVVHDNLYLLPGPVSASYNHPAIIPMNGAVGRYVRLSNIDTPDPTYGANAMLSEIQFFEYVAPVVRGTVFTFH